MIVSKTFAKTKPYL